MGYIVMLHSHDNKKLIPLVDLEDDIVEFDSEEEARKAGSQNIIGESFGFEVYKH